MTRPDLQDTLDYHNLVVVDVVMEPGVVKYIFTDKDGTHDGDGEFYSTAEDAALAGINWASREPDYDDSDGMTDAEADADVLRNAGMGTDEDYGFFGGDEYDHLERDHDEPYEGDC